MNILADLAEDCKEASEYGRSFVLAFIGKMITTGGTYSTTFHSDSEINQAGIPTLFPEFLWTA